MDVLHGFAHQVAYFETYDLIGAVHDDLVVDLFPYRLRAVQYRLFPFVVIIKVLDLGRVRLMNLLRGHENIQDVIPCYFLFRAIDHRASCHYRAGDRRPTIIRHHCTSRIQYFPYTLYHKILRFAV